MRPYLLIAVMAVFLPASLGLASTIDLSDGSTITGDIVKQSNKSVEVNVDGVTMTYYADEIKDIDGQPFAPPQTQPASPAEQPAVGTNPAVSSQSDQTVSQAQVTAQPEETSAPAGGGVDPEKRALILKFIDVFGTRRALNNNFERMLAQIQKEKPEEAQKIRDRVKIDEIIDRLVPVYARNFTSDDLKAFIAFYSSPEGRKLIHTIPELMKESVQQSIEYMREKFPEAAAKQ
ncbi:MAG: DUF2059 domain-containing protein [Candidatus Omnitrophica bacterium]|nr:DUF2059 domain-containing protein [Candidatus Omnitrophota bacterium]MDE2214664.1 DUF2059 domain-containing protein [Candidatus Omnitrophota bacterium]MDE2232012.1 DUF2059 domain-containing protein [Candidatus Omnitrophota bacterium]